jgi:acetyl esterase/lipase
MAITATWRVWRLSLNWFGIGLVWVGWAEAGGAAVNSGVPASSASVRRLAPEQLRAAHEAQQQFARQRQVLAPLHAMRDFRAVIHVHAQDSDHTGGRREEVLAAAKRAGVQVVLLTDHGQVQPDAWRGLHDGVLFLAGWEDSAAGLIRFPDFNATDSSRRADAELRFLTHVEKHLEASTAGLTGMEICNRHTDAVLDPAPLEYVRQAAAQPDAWAKLVEAFRAYPDEFFAAGSDYRPALLAKWDAETSKRRFPGIGANDAHQNVRINGVLFDPYELSFRHLCTHLFAPELTEAAIRHALREGHGYVSHDWLCDPTGFVFGAVNNLGVFPMGDPAPLQDKTRLVAVCPVPAWLKLFHRGQLVTQTNGTNLTFVATAAGPWRVEAWLPVGDEERPWIYSNPVYLQPSSLLTMRWPNAVEAPNVRVQKDVPYKEGPEADRLKHKLDLYMPTGTNQVPVVLFVHGGAWRYGDRWQYPPLGHRLAKEGLVVVIPSYRLAPQHPHPAQIEDVAAAFAWVVRHIDAYGGDPSRIFLAGHSAGAHLVSLLALHRRYLAQHNLSTRPIRGVIGISGVYDLTAFESQTAVFGRDPQVRRDASPLFWVKAPAPPFFVSYCEWDYATLPDQARRFHAALIKAGVRAELFFTPQENHIYEIISMTYDTDATGQAVVEFIRRWAG